MEIEWQKLARYGRTKDAINSYLCSFECTMAEATSAVRWFRDELRWKNEQKKKVSSARPDGSLVEKKKDQRG